MNFLYVVIYTYLSFLQYILAFNPFDDSQMYDIRWAGPSRIQDNNDDPVLITTKDNEQYQCIIPKPNEYSQDTHDPGPGPSADELLKPLTTNSRCSYRLEPYWTYEICHGSHVRQYHDEKPKIDKPLQEYILGKASKETVEKSGETAESLEEAGQKEVPRRTFHGRSVPYYEVIMDNGTPCELLEGKPRMSHIIYMCKPESRNEVVSVKEIQSCVYQFEILTPLLCGGDAYNTKEDVVHPISCHSLNGSPREPHSYIEHIEEESADRLGYREYQYMPVQGESPEDDIRNDEHRKIPPQPDQQLTNDFLNGEYCLRGGTGWWRYEYCHSKHVVQYHEGQQGKTVVYLGTWNKDVHIEWAKRHPRRKTDHVTHYYTNGDICDITGKARTVQVRLKCLQSEHLQAVSIFLLEPKPCQYVLGVDSPILCPLVEKADENWVFPATP